MFKAALMALALLLGLGVVAFQAPPAMARQSMSFSPGGHMRIHRGQGRHVSRGARSYRHATRRLRGRPGRRSRDATRHTGGRRADGGDVTTAVPGKGFTMENGVLTYPAPARFQPKNLKHR